MSTVNNKFGDGAIYDIREYSPLKKLLLGLQHTFAMFGATVLVPLITGLDVSTTLLTAGLGTLLFHLITGGKVPAFLGSSFAFLAGYAVVAPRSDEAHLVENLSAALGGVFCAGLVYIFVATLIKFYGVKRIIRFFPPVVTGPVIISIGLTLAPVAVSSASTDWMLAIVAIATIVILNIWGRGMWKIMPILIGIVVAYGFAILMGKVSFNFDNTPVFAQPIKPEYFPTFRLDAIITMTPIALATIMEHIGDMSAVSSTTGKNALANPGLNRTLAGDGVATMTASLLGGPANTTYGENTGVLTITKVYDPRVTRYAAFIAIALSFLPVVADVIRAIPAAIIGGVSLILYGMISAIGVRNLVENQVDLTKSRNLIVAAAIFVCCLGFANNPIQFSLFGATISLSGIAIGTIVGILLNALLPGKDYVFSAEDPQVPGEALSLSAVDTTEEGIHHRTEGDLDDDITAPANQKNN